MNIKRVLQDMSAFFTSQRRGGTTSLIKRISESNDVYVLVSLEREKKNFKNAVSFGQLKNELHKKPKPILVDNGTMMLLLERSCDEIEKLELGLSKRDILINKIKTEISFFQETGDVCQDAIPRMKYNPNHNFWTE